MKPSSYILNRIRNRAMTLMLLTPVGRDGQGLSRAEAERIAARELAEQQRASKPSTPPPPTDQITVSNAKRIFIARVEALAARLKATPARRNRLPRTPAPTVLPHTLDPIASSPAPAAAPANELQIIGVFAGRITSAELIDDSEFHTSVSFGDRATNNWRASIERNQRMAQRRRGLWVG